MRPTLIIPLALGLATLAGCAPRQPENEPHTAWRWDAFPQASRLLVVQLPAHAGPARSELLRTPAAGILRLTPGLDLGAPLPAGTEWAHLEAADAATEEDALRRLDNEIDRRLQRYTELEKPGVLAQLDRDIRTAEEAVATATFAEREPGLFTGERPALDPALRPALSARQLGEGLKALRERRARVEAGDTAFEPGDLQALRSEQERRRLARDTRARQSRFELPFAGHLVLADTRDGRTVTAGETVALVADPARLRIRLRASSPLLLAMASSSLVAEITLPGGATISAPFSTSGFDATTAGFQVFTFEVPAEPGAIASLGAVGADLPARIFTQLPASARIVPKLLIAREDHADALAGGWREAVPLLFPGSRVIAEGRSDVAVQPPSP
jgi:hypothetical protein